MNHSTPSLVRFSLRTLLVLMMLLCIALATTVSASPRVEYAMKWVSALLPAVAILFAAATSGSKRAFWIGFAAFGMWAYLHLEVYDTKSEIRPALRRGFSDVFDRFDDQLCTLHSTNVRAEIDTLLRKAAKDLLSRDPTLTLDDIKARYPEAYANIVNQGRRVVTDRVRSIAWNHALLAIAMLGGLAVSILYAWRNRTTSNLDAPPRLASAAGINPPARSSGTRGSSAPL